MEAQPERPPSEQEQMVASSFLALLAAGAEDNGERPEQAAEPSRAAMTSQAAAPSYAELATASDPAVSEIVIVLEAPANST